VQTQERKMVTVLFADLVDSTHLTSHLDPERMRDLQAAFYEAATRELLALRGQPEKFIGDAVMAVFGLPRAHEDDALRAVRAGLVIQTRTVRLARHLGLHGEPLKVRVGVESGIVASGVSPGGQLLVTGPAVNAAARLQTAARPGEVLIGATTYQLTLNSVSVGDERKVAAHGFDDGLIAYPVRSLTARSARRTIPLVGRRAEMDLLRTTLARVAATRRPHLFTILGEAGIGKSRLVDELVAGLEEPSTAMVGRIQPPDWGSTFSPLNEMVRALAGVGQDAPVEQIRTALEAVVEGCCDPNQAQTIATRLALALATEPEVAPPAGGAGPSASPGAEAAAGKALGQGSGGYEEPMFAQEVQAGFLELVKGLSSRAPAVVAFDGTEQAEPALLDLIERLAARTPLGPRPVLVVATGRPEFQESRPGWGSGVESHTTIRLEALDAEESMDLVRQAGGGRLDGETAARIAVRAGGNPFFIVEITGMLLRGEEAVSLTGQEELPPTVQAVVAARLDSLSPRLRELVRRASVFVFSFDLSELALVAAASEEDLPALEEAEILVRDERHQWRFRHQTVRDVAYAGLTKRERLRLHLQVADGLLAAGRRSPWVATHLERAAWASLDLDPSDRTVAERAAEALAEAGDLARRRMESRAAVKLYQRSLALSGAPETWRAREARVLAGQGEACYWLGEYEEARSVLTEAAELAERVHDDWALSAALRFLGDILVNAEGRLDEAEEILDRALAAAERTGDERSITRTLLFAGWVPWARDEFDRAEEIWSRALEMARASGDRWAQIRALTSLSVSASDHGDFDQAGRWARQAMDLATELGDRFSTAVATVQLGRSLADDHRAEEALSYFDRAIAVFEDLGSRWEHADALRTRGVALEELGRLDEAEAALQSALRISQELGDHLLRRWTWLALARVAERRGDLAVAEERRRQAGGEASLAGQHPAMAGGGG
jgi:class 3 adenylate cyclase/tetratricopeptide (TPR) repeat protein